MADETPAAPAAPVAAPVAVPAPEPEPTGKETIARVEADLEDAASAGIRYGLGLAEKVAENYLRGHAGYVFPTIEPAPAAETKE